MVRRTLTFLFIWFALAPPVQGQTSYPDWGLFPALYDVTGVASDDVLNIRSGPSTSFPILAAYAPDRNAIEVMAIANGWAQVNAAEQVGWVAARFLNRQPGQEFGDLPPIRVCFGVEPFWTLGLGHEYFYHSPMERVTVGQPVYLPSTRPDRFGLRIDVEHGIMHGVIRRTACSDGMAEATYGLAIDLIYRDAVMTGCCTIAPAR